MVPPRFNSPINSRNSIVACGSRPEVGSSRIAISARLTMISASPSRCRMPREKVATRLCATSVSRTRDSASAMRSARSVKRQPHQLGGVGEILHRREMIVEADGVGQIADTPLDLERRARRIEAEHADLAGRNLGQAQHHQDRGGLAGAVRPEQAEHLALADAERDRVDGNRLAVALGQALRRDHGIERRGVFSFCVAHRRPNLATAPSIRRSATPITPAPAMPHTVEVATVMRNWLEALSPRELARTETM